MNVPKDLLSLLLIPFVTLAVFFLFRFIFQLVSH